MIIAIFLFGVVITGVTVVGVLAIGVTEANDDAHGRADDAFTRLEREVANSQR